jgi:hypothetical protein
VLRRAISDAMLRRRDTPPMSSPRQSGTRRGGGGCYGEGKDPPASPCPSYRQHDSMGRAYGTCKGAACRTAPRPASSGCPSPRVRPNRMQRFAPCAEACLKEFLLQKRNAGSGVRHAGKSNARPILAARGKCIWRASRTRGAETVRRQRFQMRNTSFTSAAQAGFTGIGAARSTLRTSQQVAGSRTMRADLRRSN